MKNIENAIESGQKIFAFAGLIGLTGLLRALWVRFTRTPEQRLTAAIKIYQEAIKEAVNIEKASKEEAENSNLQGDSLVKEARKMKERAAANLNYASTLTAWRYSKQRDTGLAVAGLSALATLFVTMFTAMVTGGNNAPWIYLLFLSFMMIFFFIGIVICTIGKTEWIQREIVTLTEASANSRRFDTETQLDRKFRNTRSNLIYFQG